VQLRVQGVPLVPFCAYTQPSMIHRFHARVLGPTGRLACLALLLGASAAQAQKVTVEYNKQDDFSPYKTYTWIKNETYARPVLAAIIIGSVDKELQDRGFKEMESGGDLIVSIYGATDSDLRVTVTPDIYYFPPLYATTWWTPAMYRAGTSTAVYVQTGTLVVDLADPHTKTLKWRGIAKGTLDPTQKEKSAETVEKAIAKMFRQYPVRPQKK
jgi:hypothetical protein